MKRQNKAVLIALLILFSFLNLNNIQSQWVQSNGPIGGSVKQLVFNASNDAFIATNGGVFGFLSNGTSWYVANNGLTTLDIRALAVIGGNIFAGGYEVSGTQGGVFLSTNKGNSWTAVNSGLNNRTIISLGASGTNLFAGTNGAGVYVSTNNGTNWTYASSGLSGSTLTINCLYSNSTTMYAGTNDGLAVTTNNGANWTSSSSGLPTLGKAVYGISIKNSIIYVGTRNGVFQSTNNGATFTDASGNIGNLSINCLVSDATYLYAGTQGGGVFKTSNGGVNWVTYNGSLTNMYVSTIATTLPSYTWIGTSGDGVYYSLNQSNWVNLVTNLYNTSPRTINIKGTNMFTGTYLNGIYKSTNSGVNWTTANSGFGPLNIVLDIINDGTNLYAATAAGVYKSVNDGANWTVIGNGFTPTNYFQAVVKTGSAIFAGSFGGGVYATTNEGANWSAINTGLTNLNVWDLAYDATYLYAATADGGVFRVSISGGSWTQVNSGFPTGLDIRCLNAIGSKLYAGFNGLFVSTNNGDSWSSISNDSLAGKKIRSIYTYDNGNKIFAGTYNFGLYVSVNGGANFYSANTGLPLLSEIYGITVLNGTDVFMGVTGLGVWKRPLSQIVSGISAIGTEIPKEFRLGQNYPNPFNPATTIRFELPESSDIMIKVYNSAGREVSTVANGRYRAGIYEATFDASGLSSGVYFYRLITDKFSDTRKMMVVK